MFIYYLCGRENEGNCKNLRCFGQKNDDLRYCDSFNGRKGIVVYRT